MYIAGLGCVERLAFLRADLNDVDDIDVAPALFQVFGNQTAVTMVGRFLAAKKTGLCDGLLWDFHFDLPRTYQLQKTTFVIGPIPTIFLIAIEQFLSWREQRNMKVFHMGKFLQEELQVTLLRETCQLRNVIQANVDEPLCS